MIRFKAILASVPDWNYLYQEIENEMRREGGDTNTMFNRFWETWDGKPVAQFQIVTDRTKGTVTLFNYPTGDEEIIQIFKWTVHGTPPHDIEPRGNYPLRFPSPDTFTPKTQPGVIQSVEGNRGGPGEVRTFLVHHPGTTPRMTLETIDAERYDRVINRLTDATNRGIGKAKRAGRVPK